MFISQPDVFAGAIVFMGVAAALMFFGVKRLMDWFDTLEKRDNETDKFYYIRIGAGMVAIILLFALGIFLFTGSMSSLKELPKFSNQVTYEEEKNRSYYTMYLDGVEVDPEFYDYHLYTYSVDDTRHIIYARTGN